MPCSLCDRRSRLYGLEYLLREGHQVLVLDDLPGGFRENIADR